MPSGFTGFVSGMGEERERKYKENYDREAANRAMADRVFTTLLNSRDPEMQMHAIQGLAAPIGRKGGLAGYFGGVENQANPIYQHILDRANELVPDEGETPRPSAVPGSAAMSTNQMTRPGSAPPMSSGPAPGGAATPGIPMPPEQPPSTDFSSGVSAPMPPDLQMGGPQGVPMPPEPPPDLKWHKRGTGLMDAEEIAAATARATMTGRMGGAVDTLRGLGGSPDQLRRTAMGVAGAPESQNDFAQGTMGVKGPDGKVRLVSFDRTTGWYQYADGSPVPRDAEPVPIRGAGASMNQTGRLPDTAAGRQKLIEMGADPDEVSAGSPSHYWKYKLAANGEILVGPDMYTPPPNNIGTTTVLDANGNPIVRGIPRNAPPGYIAGPAVTTQQTNEQSDANALLATVNQAIKDAEAARSIGSSLKRPLSPQEKDTLTKQAAAAGQLPYTTYLEVQQAARQQRRPSVTPTTPKAAASPGGGGTGLSMAEQILQDLLSQGKGRGVPAAGVPPPPDAPAQARPSPRR